MKWNRTPKPAAAARQQRRTRLQNNVSRASGMGSQYDHSTGVVPGARTMISPYMQDRIAVELFYTDWQAKKIVSIPVADILREGWDYDGLSEEQTNKLITVETQLKVLDVFKQAMTVERLIGGSAIFIGASDGEQDATKPLNLNGISEGGLKFLNVIPRSRVTNVAWDNNPLSAGYGRPEIYSIAGHMVHRSRLIVFDGDPLLPSNDAILTPPNLIRNDGFGQSVLMGLYDDLVRATGTRQAAYQLAQRASIFIAQQDLQDLDGSLEGDVAMQEMANIVNQINLYRGAVIDRSPGDTTPPISTIAAQFGSVPELVLTNLQVLSAAGDIPAARFLGQAPGGLNTTGEGDLEQYYGRLESEQITKLKPKLMQLLEVLGRSVLGQGFNTTSVDVTFAPLWSLSAVEQATIRTQDVANVTSMVTAGMITEDEAIKELQMRDALLIEVAPSEPGEDGDDAPAPALDDTMAKLQALAGGSGGPTLTPDPVATAGGMPGPTVV